MNRLPEVWITTIDPTAECYSALLEMFGFLGCKREDVVGVKWGNKIVYGGSVPKNLVSSFISPNAISKAQLNAIEFQKTSDLPTIDFGEFPVSGYDLDHLVASGAKFFRFTKNMSGMGELKFMNGDNKMLVNVINLASVGFRDGMGLMVSVLYDIGLLTKYGKYSGQLWHTTSEAKRFSQTEEFKQYILGNR